MICSSCLNNFANELLLSECTGVHRLQNFAQGKKRVITWTMMSKQQKTRHVWTFILNNKQKWKKLTLFENNTLIWKKQDGATETEFSKESAVVKGKLFPPFLYPEMYIKPR